MSDEKAQEFADMVMRGFNINLKPLENCKELPEKIGSYKLHKYKRVGAFSDLYSFSDQFFRVLKNLDEELTSGVYVEFIILVDTACKEQLLLDDISRYIDLGEDVLHVFKGIKLIQNDFFSIPTLASYILNDPQEFYPL